MKEIIETIKAYEPYTEEEAADKKLFMEKLQFQEQLLTRENPDYHFSSSAWVVNSTYDKVLMVYHNLLLVAQKELEEETGIKEYHLLHDGLFAFNILPVPAHYKNGQYIKEHNHINTTYLFMAQEDQTFKIKEDENSDVRWIAVTDIDQKVTEEAMKVYYHQMVAKALSLKK